MLLALISVPMVASGDRGLKGGTPKDNAAATKPAPSGTWKGICDNGGPDWGDPMPIELTFRRDGEDLAVDAVIDFESDKKEPRRAKAKLLGKRVDARWKLRGKMTDVKDATEWDIELETQLDGNKLSGKLVELDNENALMCQFSWTKK